MSNNRVVNRSSSFCYGLFWATVAVSFLSTACAVEPNSAPGKTGQTADKGELYATYVTADDSGSPVPQKFGEALDGERNDAPTSPAVSGDKTFDDAVTTCVEEVGGVPYQNAWWNHGGVNRNPTRFLWDGGLCVATPLFEAFDCNDFTRATITCLENLFGGVQDRTAGVGIHCKDSRTGERVNGHILNLVRMDDNRWCPFDAAILPTRELNDQVFGRCCHTNIDEAADCVAEVQCFNPDYTGKVGPSSTEPYSVEIFPSDKINKEKCYLDVNYENRYALSNREFPNIGVPCGINSFEMIHGGSNYGFWKSWQDDYRVYYFPLGQGPRFLGSPPSPPPEPAGGSQPNSTPSPTPGSNY